MSASAVPELGPNSVPEVGSDVSFRDPTESIDERVAALLAKLTLDEQVAMLHSYAPAVHRLGVPPFHTGGEALHGVVGSVPGTVFPQAVGLAASWNPDLLEQVGGAVGNELQALLQRDPPDRHLGPNVWAPVVNLLRDPRWGRNEEGYSEDPLLTVALAGGYCRGLRSGDPGPRAAPTLKHFVAYNHEGAKFATSVSVRPRVLREYDLPPFQELIRQGLADAVMPSYHIVNGRPNHLSEYFRLLRQDNPHLVIVADGFGPSDIIEKSRYYPDRKHAYQAAIRAGLDSFTDHWRDPTITLSALHDALTDGMLSAEDIAAAAGRLLRMRIMLGEFDTDAAGPPPAGVRNSWHGALALHAARESMVLLQNDGLLPLGHAQSSPPERVAVIGPMADRVCVDWYSGELPYQITPLAGLQTLLGADRVTYTSGVDRIRLRSATDDRCLTVTATGEVVLQPPAEQEDRQAFDVYDWGEGTLTLRSAATGKFLNRTKQGRLVCDQDVPNGWDVQQTFEIDEADGVALLRHQFTGRYVAADPDGDGDETALWMSAEEPDQAHNLVVDYTAYAVQTAAAAAWAADKVVVFVGTHPQINGREGFDRKELCLPAGQERMVQACLDANPRTAVVLVSGHPLTVPAIAERAPAMLWSCHAGQEIGRALADVITGTYPPTGRLPQTWYRDIDELGDILDYDIIKSRRTYLYSDREPLYPFGHGLTYTTFGYAGLSLSQDVAGPEDVVTVTAEVTNSGAIDCDEVVQLYVRALDPPADRPLRQLRGFQRVAVPVGTTVPVEFQLPVRDLAYWNVALGDFTVAPGRYEVMVGRSATDLPERAVLTVAAPPLLARDLSRTMVRAVNFDDYADISIVDEERLAGEAVRAERPGAWVVFRDVDLGPESERCAVARAGTVGDGAGAVQVRLHDPVTGPVVAELEVPHTPDPRHGWVTVTAPVVPAAGRCDVYLVFPEPVRISTFSLAPAADGHGGR